MNKKGFTLVELLAVITILAVIMTIAAPSVISIIEDNNRQAALSDAKRMVSKAKGLYSANVEDRRFIKKSASNTIKYEFKCPTNANNPASGQKISASCLNEDNEFPDNYDGSFVTVSISSNEVKYCIYMKTGKYTFKTSKTSETCIDSSIINGDNWKNNIF